MARVATYVFMDLETTGLPKEELNKTRITEICMMAVKRQHILETRRGKTPRVRHNLTLCLNPGRMIQPTCSEVTGLCNDLLEHETLFNLEVYTMICSFLNVLTKPVCLVAQNGLNFDFPILKAHVEKLGVSLPQDLVCADCYFAFYHILERPLTVENEVTVTDSSNTVTSINCGNKPEPSTSEQDDVFSMQKANESTPKTKPNLTLKTQRKANSSKVRRRFPWGEGPKPKESYKLAQIYERILKRPSIDAHRAENDCIMALELAVALSKEFVEYVDNNHYLFSNIAPMTVGVPLGHFTAPTYWEPELKNLLVNFESWWQSGLLVVTGALWGCTNPFIRQGTRGLREVKGNTYLQQATAEIYFLLSNWRYVVPWLVNQAGSLVYLCAVQRAPLSLAVPAANGLAFAFTAITGALARNEQPLNERTILGIIFIVTGTGLCCLDKTG